MPRFKMTRPLAQVVLFGNSATYAQQILAYNPVFFLDANDSNLWQDSSRTTVATANADPVGAWDDLSRNGYHFTQTTTSLKPSLRTSVQNGLNVIRFELTGDYLDYADGLLTGDHTVYDVSYATTNAIGSHMFDIRDTGDGTPVNANINYANDKRRYLHRDDGSTLTTLTSTNDFDETWNIGTFWQSGTSMVLYVNDTSEATDTHAGAATGMDRTRIGASAFNEAQPFNGDIAALIGFSSAHDAATRTAIINILNARYAIF